MALNAIVKVECPKCGRQHERAIENGQIKDVAKYDKTTIVVVSMPSTYSKTAVLGRSKPLMRDGCVVQDPSRDFVNDRCQGVLVHRVCSSAVRMAHPDTR